MGVKILKSGGNECENIKRCENIEIGGNGCERS
jgi:hypothetical protein